MFDTDSIDPSPNPLPLQNKHNRASTLIAFNFLRRHDVQLPISINATEHLRQSLPPGRTHPPAVVHENTPQHPLVLRALRL